MQYYYAVYDLILKILLTMTFGSYNIRLTFKSVPEGLGVVLAPSFRKNHDKGFARLKRLLVVARQDSTVQLFC